MPHDIKYGIVTHYDVHNHGALLQLYALKKVLSRLGIEAFALQYDKNYDFLGREMKSKYEISIKSVGIYLNFLKERGIADFIFNYKKRQILNRFRKQFNLVGNYYTDYSDLDGIVIGSDEVFALHTGPTPALFGYALPSNKVFSYAGSFGPTTIDDIRQLHCQLFVSGGLNGMSGISVRDQNSLSIVQELTNKPVELVCDPVILYGFENEIKAAANPMDQPYMVVYSYDNRFDDSADEIRKYAKNNGLKIVSPGFYQKWADTNINATPIELFQWFKNAHCVVTNTFHGCVLSLITGREVAVKIRDNSNKLLNLMKEYQIGDRVFTDGDSLTKVFHNNIDWEQVNTQISLRRAASLSFLNRMIAL